MTLLTLEALQLFANYSVVLLSLLVNLRVHRQLNAVWGLVTLVLLQLLFIDSWSLTNFGVLQLYGSRLYYICKLIVLCLFASINATVNYCIHFSIVLLS